MPAPSPSRRPQISRDFLEEHRRRRYVEAVAELLHEFGRPGPSVTNIVRLAGTARNSFYEVFRSGDDCIAFGIGVAAEELFATLDAQDAEGEWLVEVHDAIAGFYETVAAGPVLAELYLIHAAASRGDHGRAPSDTGAERFTGLLRRGHEEAETRGRRPPPAVTEECLALGIIALARRRVRAPAVEDLPGESVAIARLVGGYYLGPEEAGKILAQRLAAETRS